MARKGMDLDAAKLSLDKAMARLKKGDNTALLEVNRLSAILARKTPGVMDKINARREEIDAAERKILTQVKSNMDLFARSFAKIDKSTLDDFLTKASSGNKKVRARLGNGYSVKGYGIQIVVEREDSSVVEDSETNEDEEDDS